MAKEMAKTKETVIEAEGKVIDNSNGVYRLELDN